MSENFNIGIIPTEKQRGGIKFILEVKKRTALGNIYGLTENELKELELLILRALKAEREV